MWVVEERVKLENAGGDLWDGKAKFGVEAEDFTDEIIGFWGNGSSSSEVVVIEHEIAESSAANNCVVPWREPEHIHNSDTQGPGVRSPGTVGSPIDQKLCESS